MSQEERGERAKRGWAVLAIEGLLILAAVAALVFVLAGKRYDNADLLRHFDIVAFNTEFDGPSPYVSRWQGPVRIFVKGPETTSFQRQLAAFVARELAPLTGLEFDFVAREGAANVVVFHYPRAALFGVLRPYWRDDGDLGRMLSTSLCFVRLHHDRDYRLRYALVAIPAYKAAERVRGCIVEEMTQAMGLINDADEVQPSIFNDRSLYEELTEHDRHLLRVLYDPRLKPGMTGEEAMPIVRRIVAEIPLAPPAARLAAATAAPPLDAGNADPQPPATQDAPGN